MARAQATVNGVTDASCKCAGRDLASHLAEPVEALAVKRAEVAFLRAGAERSPASNLNV